MADEEEWPEVLTVKEMADRWPGMTPKMVLVSTPGGIYKRESDGWRKLGGEPQ